MLAFVSIEVHRHALRSSPSPPSPVAERTTTRVGASCSPPGCSPERFEDSTDRGHLAVVREHDDERTARVVAKAPRVEPQHRAQVPRQRLFADDEPHQAQAVGLRDPGLAEAELGGHVVELVLREHVGPRRASAVLALVGVINLPIIHFSVEWWNTLHQPASVTRIGTPAIHPDMLRPLLIMALAYLALFVVLLLMRMRLELTRRKVEALQTDRVGAAGA